VKLEIYFLRLAAMGIYTPEFPDVRAIAAVLSQLVPVLGGTVLEYE
jgi:hypothetical protein